MAEPNRWLYDPSTTRGLVLAHRGAGDPVSTSRTALAWVLAASLLVVALVTLQPTGVGWAWGSPVTELHWYATSLDSRTAVMQLTGNLGLLAPAAALAVALRPSLASPPRLVALALVAGTSIEVLQWALPLGRVVSPLDAVLNAIGAVAAGLLVARLPGFIRHSA
jgi:hypothetical protein